VVAAGAAPAGGAGHALPVSTGGAAPDVGSPDPSNPFLTAAERAA
jgi:hypothetical protein